VLFFGIAFVVGFGLGGATVFFTGGGAIFFGATFFGITLTGGFGVTAVVPPLRPSIMILPSWV
jgi:hypothetical protein